MSSILNDDKDFNEVMKIKSVLFDLIKRQEELRFVFDKLEQLKQDHLKILNELGE